MFLSLCPRLLVIFVTMKPHNSQESLGKMSKCARNYLKSQETMRQEAKSESEQLEEGGDHFDNFKMMRELGNGMSPCIYSEKAHMVNRNCKNIKLFQESKSILIDFNNGRLGNQMSSFASTFAVSKVLNIKQMLTFTTYLLLSKYFNLPEENILEQEFCDPCNFLEFTPIQEASGSFGQALYMPAYPNTIEVYKDFLDSLRQKFTFHHIYQKKAQEFLQKVKTSSKFENPVFVAIHNRRGDYNFAIKSYGGKLVGRKYFDLSVKVFRENIKDAIFVVVSDDIEWAEENIVGENIFFSGDDDSVDAVGTDLAIMAHCNHTIMTYGTFGMWGAFLANGKVIATENAAKEELNILKRLENEENWIFIDEDNNIEDYKLEITKLFQD